MAAYFLERRYPYRGRIKPHADFCERSKQDRLADAVRRTPSQNESERLYEVLFGLWPGFHGGTWGACVCCAVRQFKGWKWGEVLGFLESPPQGRRDAFKGVAYLAF
jgi:hypothetical protein